MAENQPRKAGEYERPMTGTTSSMAFIIGGIALLAVIIIALLFLR
jgi:LPXTG-motif cell wall-anchored protein